MREVELNKSGAFKAKAIPAELYFSDIQTSIKGYAPGEWVFFVNTKSKERFVGFLNPTVPNSAPCAAILKNVAKESFDEWSFISETIAGAIERRRIASDYGMNARMFFGASDGLPGLIADSFENCALIQINTAGLDKFRNQIRDLFQKLLNREAFLLDNPEYRSREGLPEFERDWSLEELEVREGNLKFSLEFERLQKVGFYYDHRENRKKLADYLSRITPPEKGLDLFCYAGAWGMTLAKSGISSVDFVDQGDFSASIKRNLASNGIEKEYAFYREDCFQFLKNSERENYDIIVSDPPAFCKSPKGAKKATEGYLKLHRLCLRALKDKSFFAACSCTHYVGFEDFIQTVSEAAKLERKKIILLDVGTQGFDHPSRSLKDNSNYLKYALFHVEKL